MVVWNSVRSSWGPISPKEALLQTISFKAHVGTCENLIIHNIALRVLGLSMAGVGPDTAAGVWTFPSHLTLCAGSGPDS